MGCLGGGTQLAKIGVYGQDFKSYIQAFDGSVLFASWYHILSSPGKAPRLPNSKPGKFHELPEKDEPLCPPEPYQQRWPAAMPICGPGLGSSQMYEAHKPPPLRFCEQCPTASEKRLLHVAAPCKLHKEVQ